MPEQAEQQQPTFDLQTRLALERTRVAYDGTMMAWIRTATSLITFGFGVYKFFQLELKIVGRENQRIGAREFALLMVGVGVLEMVLGTLAIGETCEASEPRIPRCLIRKPVC